jgi:hypothetical protein
MRSSSSVFPDGVAGKSTGRKWNPSFSDRESLSFLPVWTGAPGPGTMCDMECAHVVLVEAREVFAGSAREVCGCVEELTEGAPGLPDGTDELKLVALDIIVVELAVALPPAPRPSVSLGHFGMPLIMHALIGSGHRISGFDGVSCIDDVDGVGVAPSSTVWVIVTVTTTLLVSLAAWAFPEISSCGRASVLASRVRRTTVV